MYLIVLILIINEAVQGLQVGLVQISIMTDGLIQNNIGADEFAYFFDLVVEPVVFGAGDVAVEYF